MINEWEEFCAYTGTVSYTASKKSDTTWLGRFTFATILEFEGMARILTILARGYLFHGNSLLNLVTEEQRPLRVCMNNGKEFLLFPQDLLAPICDSDFRLILLSAMRYAMGRNTCMPMVVADYIKRHIQLLDDKFLVLAADDIRRHLEDYAEHEMNPNLWHGLLGALETEQRERATRKARKIRPCPACGKPLEVMSITDNGHSPDGFVVIAHCQNCHSDYEWFCDKDGGTSDMKQYFFG